MRKIGLFASSVLLSLLLVFSAFGPAAALESEISGQINQMVMYADDGDEDDFFIADNDSSSTRIRVTGAETFDWVKVGFRFEIEAQRNASNLVTIDQDSDGGFQWNDRWFNVYFTTSLGTLEIGKGDAAANGTTEVDLSGTSVVTYSDVNATGGSIVWQDDAGNPYRTDLAINDTRSNFDGSLSRTERLRYNTPNLAGFVLSGSVANGDGYDASLWYAAELYGKLAAAIGYTDMGDRGDFEQWGGSISWLAPFGLNLTAVYGKRDFDAAGVEDATNYLGKIGYKFGIHAVSLEYGVTEDLSADGDESSNYGLAYVVTPWKSVELYAAYRHYMLDAGVGPDPEDIQVAMAGTRVKF